MRTRLLLATAVAAVAIPLFFMAIFGGTPAGHTPGQATDQPVNFKLMSYQEASKLVAYANAVEANRVKTYLQEAAFLTAVANAENTMPAAWLPTAICEEGGRDDPNAGYFGIKEWNGFEGYGTAGSAPLSVQLAWEARYIGGPPDAPGECHSY
jgi:hypothetical protein